MTQVICLRRSPIFGEFSKQYRRPNESCLWVDCRQHTIRQHSLRYHSVTPVSLEVNFWSINILTVCSLSVYFWEVEIFFKFRPRHSSQMREIHCYSQGIPFLLEASEMSQDVQDIFKGDIDKWKCIQKKVTRLVKCLETCHVRNVSVILCLESSNVESERCSTSLQGNDNFLQLSEELPCETWILYFLNSSRGQNLGQCMAGARTIVWAVVSTPFFHTIGGALGILISKSQY